MKENHGRNGYIKNTLIENDRDERNRSRADKICIYTASNESRSVCNILICIAIINVVPSTSRFETTRERTDVF